MKYIHPKKWLRLTLEKVSDIWFNYILPDKVYLKYQYKKTFGRKLNLKNPLSFNEKLHWLKLYDRNPNYHLLIDKYEVKNFIANTIGEEYIIKTYGVWKNFDEIDFNQLPEKFVLKCTHDSASVVFCKDKSKFDRIAAKKKLTKALKTDYYRTENRQWVYKDIEPRIIAEEFLIDESGEDLKDYKFFCFNGEVKYIQVDLDRFTNHKRNIYNLEWKFQDFQILFNNDPTIKVEKPEKFPKMLEIVSRLSQGIPHVRVDLYFVNKKIYFGEMTFCHGGGTEHFIPEIWDYKFGSFINLPLNK